MGAFAEATRRRTPPREKLSGPEEAGDGAHSSLPCPPLALPAPLCYNKGAHRGQALCALFRFPGVLGGCGEPFFLHVQLPGELVRSSLTVSI